MKTLTYKIEISASRQKVWGTMLQLETYKQWTGVSWPDSSYEGEWKEGSTIRFIGTDGSGTMALLIKCEAPSYVSAKHVAILLPGGIEDRDSEMAKGWVGIMENYTFTEKSKGTELIVEIITNPAWEKMFDEGWPNALKKLKEICEK